MSDNVITDGSGASLYPNRIANAGFSGKIASLSSQNRAVGGLGGIQGTVTNLKNAADARSFTTDKNGEYEAEGVIPGDTYEVEVEDEKISFTPAGNGDNAGAITLNENGGANFKVSFEQFNTIVYAHPSSSGSNSSDQYLSGRIIIKNTGGIDATGVTYQLTPKNGLSVSNALKTGILGTIEPGRTKEISIKISRFAESSIRACCGSNKATPTKLVLNQTYYKFPYSRTEGSPSLRSNQYNA